MRAVELLMHYTTYILSWLGWMLPELLGDGLLLTLLGNGLLLDAGLLLSTEAAGVVVNLIAL